MIAYHVYNNGYNNPVCDAHKTAGALYTWQNTVDSIPKELYLIS